MVIPASHKAPIWDHHTDFGTAGGGHLFVGGVEATNCDASSAVQLCGRAGSVSFHHVRTMHGSDHNRSKRSRRILFIECIGADAWPLLGCPEFSDDSTAAMVTPRPWYCHAPAEFDPISCSLRSPNDPTLSMPLTMPSTDNRGTAMMGHGVSDRPRMERVPVRIPLPRAAAPPGPGSGIYATQTLLTSKTFGNDGSKDGSHSAKL